MHPKLNRMIQNAVRSNRFRYKCSVMLLSVLVIYVVLLRHSSEFEEFSTKSPVVSSGESKSNSITHIIEGLNKIGQAQFEEKRVWTSFIKEAFRKQKESEIESLITNLTEASNKVFQEAQLRNVTRLGRIKKTGPKINLAVIICGRGRLAEGLTMIKSASMFAQDASLNVIAFSDSKNIVELGTKLFLLRRMVNIAGWDFTFELHLEWFPPRTSGESWREMYAQCTTMRLFFPDLLPHIDSIIYLDTDVVVVSNMTELWNKIPMEMGDKKMAAAASNTEQNSIGHYTYNKLPHFGKQGLNAGIMLMNLTQMRQFNLSNRATGIKRAYSEKLLLADQDIYNAIFHAYDDRFLLLSCTYNIYSVHCNRGATCNRETNKDTCFCEAARIHGMHLIHGCQETFWKYLGRDHFIQQIYWEFNKFDVIRETPQQLLAKIKEDFKPQPDCYNVDYDMVYRNAQNYFAELYKSNGIK